MEPVTLKEQFHVLEGLSDSEIQTSIAELRKEYRITHNGNTPSFGRGGQPVDHCLSFVDLSLSDDEENPTQSTGTNGGRSVYSHMDQEIQRKVAVLMEKTAEKIIHGLDLDPAILNDVKKDTDELDRALKAEMKSTNNDFKAVMDESIKYSDAAVSKSCLCSHQIALAVV